jgi:hypothetical protein
MEFEWETPASQTPVERADRVELFSLPKRDIVPEQGWPDSFWKHVGERATLNGAEAREVIQLFQELEPAESARCHMPPWGLAMYAGDELLFTVTLCYQCYNAYLYSTAGRDLRAFDSQGVKGLALRRVLEKHLPLTE